MLDDTLSIIRGNQDTYNSFLSLFKTPLHTNWDSQFNNEDKEGYNCTWATIGQYVSIYNYVTLLVNSIMYETNNWATLQLDYNINEYTKYLMCIGVDINDIYNLFDIKFTDDNLYVWVDKYTIQIKLLVKTTGNVTIATAISSTGSTHINWSNGVYKDLANGNNTETLVAGLHYIYISGRLDTITNYTLTGTSAYIVEEIQTSESLNSLSSIVVDDNNLTAKSVDELIVIVNKIADNNNIINGTLTLNGGTNEDILKYIPCATTIAYCNLKNKLNWNISINNILPISCT